MGVMDFVRKIASKKSEKSEKFKQMQEEDRLETMLHERKKSANRREYERYLEQQEEKQIKAELDRIHKQQSKQMWRDKSILKSGNSILRNDRPLLKEKNIFKGSKPTSSKCSMGFFK